MNKITLKFTELSFLFCHFIQQNFPKKWDKENPNCTISEYVSPYSLFAINKLNCLIPNQSLNLLFLNNLSPSNRPVKERESVWEKRAFSESYRFASR